MANPESGADVVDIHKAKGAVASEIGASGLIHWGGIVGEEFLRDLQGARARKVYAEMLANDSVIAGIFFGIEQLVRQVEWHVEPADDSKAAKDEAEFISGCLDDMSYSWEDTLAQIVSFVPMGFHFAEIVYKYRQGDKADASKRSQYDDGRVGWRKFAGRAQDTLLRWEFDDEGSIQGFVQYQPGGATVTIPMERGLLFRTTTHKENPEGKALLRAMYPAYYRKNRIQEHEAIGIERDLAGLPKATAPIELFGEGASPEAKAALLEIKRQVERIRMNEQGSIVVPAVYDESGHPLYDFQLVTTGGARQYNTDAVISRYNQQMAMSLLADFLLLGHEGVGSHSLGISKIQLFTMALQAFVDSIAATFNAYATPRLLKLNGIDVTLAPTIKASKIEQTDVAGLGAYVQQLAASGIMLTDEETQNFLRRVGGLPELEKGQGAKASGTAVPSPTKDTPPAPPPDQQAQDQAAADAKAAADKAAKEVAAKVRKARRDHYARKG